MAAVTVTTEAATVNIVSPMAAIAMVCGLFMYCQIRPVALFTIDLAVFSFQWKVSLVVMIEGPQHPGVGIVALTALLTHTALVRFFVFMAGEAGGFGLLKLCIQVAGFTSGNAVEADQGKTGNVMLEKELHVPSLFIVAITAILAQFILVDVDRTMTGDTVSLFEIVHRHAAVAGAADQVLVLPLERKIGIFPVIEFHLGPTIDAVAILTLLAIPAFVHIVLLMA